MSLKFMPYRLNTRVGMASRAPQPASFWTEAFCRSDSDASVGYYGVNIQSKLDEARNIKTPLMLHVAGQDEHRPPEAQKALLDGPGKNPHVTLHV